MQDLPLDLFNGLTRPRTVCTVMARQGSALAFLEGDDFPGDEFPGEMSSEESLANLLANVEDDELRKLRADLKMYTRTANSDGEFRFTRQYACMFDVFVKQSGVEWTKIYDPDADGRMSLKDFRAGVEDECAVRGVQSPTKSPTASPLGGGPGEAGPGERAPSPMMSDMSPEESLDYFLDCLSDTEMGSLLSCLEGPFWVPSGDQYAGMYTLSAGEGNKISWTKIYEPDKDGEVRV